MKHRVVITGLGMITPLGKSVEENWRKVLAGESGIDIITLFDPANHRSQIAGEVKNFKPEKDLAGIFPNKDTRRMDRFIQFSLFAAGKAIEDAGLSLAESDSRRIGVSIGVGFGGMCTISEEMERILKKGPRYVSPFMVPGCIANLAPGQISIAFGIKGACLAITTACAAGAHAIGEGLRSIQGNETDIMLAGGAEAPVVSICMAGFENMGALSTRWNNEPKKASRPFDRDRDGFVVAEGAGVLVLEELQHALNRGAKIYGEVIGFARNADAFHITQPDKEGQAECMRSAIKDAMISPNDVDYINAHATSTPLGDITETQAIKRAFGKRASEISVSSTKSTTGHLSGAAGAVASIFTVLALKEGIIPPTINLDQPDSECDLDYVPGVARRKEIEFALLNSFGFGGSNACLVFRKFTEA